HALSLLIFLSHATASTDIYTLSLHDALPISFHNRSPHPVEYEFSYHLSHLAPGCSREESASRNTVIPNRGVFLHNSEKPNSESLDRKSTRLNSSHDQNSYAVFCLKKKKGNSL